MRSTAARVLTRPLRSEIARALPERPFALRFWDGSVVPATVQGAPEFHARTPAALTHFLRSPGELGLGRAYVEGDLVTDDLDAAFEVVDGWEPPAVATADRIRLTAAAIAAAGWAGIPRMPAIELILKGERHSAARDAAAVGYHYDVGNDFFALFLDASMTYSCAIFSRGAQTLEDAQRTKLELVATKLGLQPGQRVLDVGAGSGWTTALLAHLTGPGGVVLGVELEPTLTTFGAGNLGSTGYVWASIRQAVPGVLGVPEEAPYDRILVSANATSLPGELVEQLGDAGRMVIPVSSTMMLVERHGEDVRTFEHGAYRFVPLR